MTYLIPQHTSFKIPIFVQTDANDRTAVTGITPSTMEVYVKKFEQPLNFASGNGGVVELEVGFGIYQVILDEVDTNTVGALTVVVDASPSGFVHIIELQITPNPNSIPCVVMDASTTSILVSGLPPSDDDDHWIDGLLRVTDGNLVGQHKRITASTEVLALINGATYDDLGHAAGDYLLYAPGLFAGYTFTVGDRVRLFAGTDMSLTTHEIASRVSDDAVLFTASASVAGADSIDGSIIVLGLTRLTVAGGFTSAPAVDDHAVIVGE